MPRQYTSNRVERACQTCGKLFYATSSNVARGNAKFCSRACVGSRIEDRFWPRVEQSAFCWLWTGPFTEKGYGILGRGGFQGGNVLAHRLSWELHFGAIPAGILVCHHCDIPRCVRPDHLFLGSNTDNLVDMTMKNRHGMAKLTTEMVYAMRIAHRQGENCAAIARRYGVSRTAAWQAILGHTWPHVPMPN